METEFSRTHEHYRGLSFATISAFGAHASMAHYAPTEDTDKQITREEIYLFDAGTQYKGMSYMYIYCSNEKFTASGLTLSYFRICYLIREQMVQQT